MIGEGTLKSNYINRDDVMQAFLDNLETSEVGVSLNEDAFYMSLKYTIQPADVVEVVWCKDCKHYVPSFLDGQFKGDCPFRRDAVDIDGYCNLGERK